MLAALNLRGGAKGFPGKLLNGAEEAMGGRGRGDSGSHPFVMFVFFTEKSIQHEEIL